MAWKLENQLRLKTKKLLERQACRESELLAFSYGNVVGPESGHEANYDQAYLF